MKLAIEDEDGTLSAGGFPEPAAGRGKSDGGAASADTDTAPGGRGNSDFGPLPLSALLCVRNACIVVTGNN